MSNGKVLERVLNIKIEDVWHKSKSRIGTLHRVDLVRLTNENDIIEVTEKEVVIRKMTVDRQEANTKMKFDLKLNIGDVNFTEKQK